MGGWSFDCMGNGWCDMGQLEKWRCGRWNSLNKVLGYTEGGKEGADVPKCQSHGNEGFVELER